MAESPNHRRTIPLWATILAVGLGLRVLAAFLVTGYVEKKGTPCVFGDTTIYRQLAESIVLGKPYMVDQFGSPHYALRTPGYPIFLAACREIFGPSLLAVRLVQAALGTLGVWLVANLAGAVLEDPHDPNRPDGPTDRTIPLMAAGLAAVHPYLVGMSALVLSEATFLPAMLAGLWGLASLWGSSGPRRATLVALGTGLAMGSAILSRPSWALFLPAILAFWVARPGPGSGRGIAWKRASIVALSTACVLAPWWVRNAQVIGKFVPTALWVGASLYDGIGPQANGESEMKFVEEPDVRSLGEVEQDEVFRSRSIAFARSHPGRAVELAAIKFGRFWSPWPNAGTLRGLGVAAASASWTIPTFALIGLGAWSFRRDPRTLALLAGPLAYFCLLHMVFVSSIRYRIPGEAPAMGLAAVGLIRASMWLRPRASATPPNLGSVEP